MNYSHTTATKVRTFSISPRLSKRKRETEEKPFDFSSIVSGCGLINDYRSLSNYLKEFSDFIHWYEQMFARKPWI